MEPERNDDLAELLPLIATQLRGALSNLHLAAAQLAPAAHRERDAELDGKAARLDQSYYRLLRLVNNLNAAAALSAKDPLPLQDWDLAELVQAQFEESVSLAELIGIHLRYTCAMDHCLCAVHRAAMEQIFFQLLSNALKFTPAGGTVTVELKRSGALLLLSISDTGRGIDPERMPLLFEGYRRENAMDLPAHGLGLGLPICRRLAEAMGGRLLAESRLGQGSQFTLALPDRQAGTTGVSDLPLDYLGGFNRTLLALADALPAGAFTLRDQK